MRAVAKQPSTGTRRAGPRRWAWAVLSASGSAGARAAGSHQRSNLTRRAASARRCRFAPPAHACRLDDPGGRLCLQQLSAPRPPTRRARLETPCAARRPRRPAPVRPRSPDVRSAGAAGGGGVTLRVRPRRKPAATAVLPIHRSSLAVHEAPTRAASRSFSCAAPDAAVSAHGAAGRRPAHAGQLYAGIGATTGPAVLASAHCPARESAVAAQAALTRSGAARRSARCAGEAYGVAGMERARAARRCVEEIALRYCRRGPRGVAGPLPPSCTPRPARARSCAPTATPRVR